MKKLSIVMLSVLILLSLFLTACSDSLSGTYTDSSNRTIEFKGDDKMSFSGFDGKYTVDDDKITFVFDSDSANNVQEYSFSEVDDVIVIDGVQYKKNK